MKFSIVILLFALLAAFSIQSTQAQGYCSLCSQFADYAEAYIKESGLNATAIINEFEDLTCNNLPIPFSTICDEFVESYGYPIINCLAQGTNATVCCQQVGLCSIPPKAKQTIQTTIPAKFLQERRFRKQN